MARNGMTDLIDRVRAFTDAGTADYTSGTITYWTDDHIQSILDRNVDYVIETPLHWRVQTISGGSAVYKVAQSSFTDWETLDSGTARFFIQDSTGSIQATANYSVNYERGEITWTSDQGGTSYYLTGYSYDINGAAAEVLEQRIASFTLWYDFRADNQSLSRDQAWQHLKDTLDYHKGLIGSNKAKGVMRIGQFVRTDLIRNAWQ